MHVIAPAKDTLAASSCAILACRTSSRTFVSNILSSVAEFRGPGIHHRFDDSPDDYDMDMDQRTRMLGGRAGRIILLGDGTEVLTDHHDDDTAMVDQSEDEEKDLESQVKKGQEAAKSEGGAREETPAPTAVPDKLNKEDEEKLQEAKNKAGAGQAPEEPKMMAATDSADSKTVGEHMEAK